jgi:hypothetical protein
MLTKQAVIVYRPSINTLRVTRKQRPDARQQSRVYDLSTVTRASFARLIGVIGWAGWGANVITTDPRRSLGWSIPRSLTICN